MLFLGQSVSRKPVTDEKRRLNVNAKVNVKNPSPLPPQTL